MLKKILLAGIALVLLSNSCRTTQATDIKALTNLNTGEPLLDLTEFKILDPKLADRMGTSIGKETGYELSYYRSELQSKLNRKTEDVNFPNEVYYPELYAIYLYTRSTYSKVNSDLRKLPPSPADAKTGQIIEQDANKANASMPNVVQLIASGINKMPKHACSAQRGTTLPSDIAKNIEDERYYTERAFVSTSEGGDSFGGQHKYVVNSESCPKSISGISNYENEKEILFPPGSEFEVTRVQKKGGYRRYCVRHVYPSPPGLKPNPILSQMKTSNDKKDKSNSSSDSYSSDYKNIAPPIPRPLDEITWMDLICGTYEADEKNEDCNDLPKFVQFNGIKSALIQSPNGNQITVNDWSLQDGKTAGPKVKLQDFVFDIQAVDTLSYKSCIYKEKIIED